MNRGVRRVLGVVAVLALLGAATLAWVALRSEPVCDDALRDLDGRCAVLDEAPDVAGADLRPTGGRFQAPEQDLDVPLVEMSLTGGTLNPPSLTDAFLVRGDQSEGSGRARLVAMHAVRDGRAPGNAFFEPGVADPAVLIGPGDPVVVDGMEFTVTKAEVLTKDEAAVSQEIWGDQPDAESRLVVVTCLQRAGTAGPAAENLVVHAVRA